VSAIILHCTHKNPHLFATEPNYGKQNRQCDEQIYKNKKCTIRKGTLYVKPTTRGRKKQGD